MTSMQLWQDIKQTNMRYFIPFLLILLIGSASCQLLKTDNRKGLICGTTSKTWILDHTTKNGVLVNNRRPDEALIKLVFNSKGEMDMGASSDSYWRIRENCDTIWFTINGITKINYADKIIKLTKDTFIIQLITDEQDTIVDYLYHLNQSEDNKNNCK